MKVERTRAEKSDPPRKKRTHIGLRAEEKKKVHNINVITILSISDRAVAKALNPIKGTAKPSARVGSALTAVGLPSSMDLVNPAHFSDSMPLNGNRISVPGPNSN